MPHAALLDRTAETLDRLLAAGDAAGLGNALAALHPADAAHLLSDRPAEAAATALAALPLHRRAEVFGYLAPDRQREVATRLGRGDLVALLEAMAHDERADLIGHLDPSERDLLLPALAQAERDDLLHLVSYPAGSVGAAMTSDYATIPAPLTAPEALEHLRRVAPDAETIYTSWVVDADGRLIGRVRLRDLIVARPGMTVERLMQRDPPRLLATAPRAEAVAMIARYDALALPVTDAAGRLIGIVTHDDVADIAADEARARFHRAGAVGDVPAPLPAAGVGVLYRSRVGWLVLLILAHILAGLGITLFEDAIAAHLVLLFFLPMLIASGGNAGAQAATLMVRAIATGEVKPADWGRLMARELAVAAALGLTMAAVVAGIGLVHGGPQIAAVVALTMLVIVVASSVTGLSLPFLLHRFGADPATASSPLITSLADALGVVIYFGIASWMLGVAFGG